MNLATQAALLTFVAAGVDLLEALTRMAGPEGWVSGTGYVEGVELRVAAEGTDAVSTLSGRYNLLSLGGPRGGPFSVTLARSSHSGIEVFGGELVQARSAGVTVTLQPATRAAALPASKALAAPATWARTAAANAAAAAHDDEGHAEEPPEAGDLVQHFAFGLCEVLTAEGDRLRIRDMEAPRRVREVSLTMLRVTGPTDSDGKRLFHLVRRTPS